MFFQQVYDKSLAQASYFIGCQKAGVATVIDAKRDVDTVTELERLVHPYTTVVLKPVLVIKEEHNAEKAMRVLEKTEKACLVSNSIKAIVKLAAVVKILHS